MSEPVASGVLNARSTAQPRREHPRRIHVSLPADFDQDQAQLIRSLLGQHCRVDDTLIYNPSSGADIELIIIFAETHGLMVEALDWHCGTADALLCVLRHETLDPSTQQYHDVIDAKTAQIPRQIFKI